MHRILLCGGCATADLDEIVKLYERDDSEVWINSRASAGSPVPAPVPSGETFRAVEFDAMSSVELVATVAKSSLGFSAIVVPYPVECVNAVSVNRITRLRASLRYPLRVIGVPNDSLRHLGANISSANVPVVNSPGIHRDAVAEYALFQIGFHARRLEYFYESTRELRSWRHEEAAATTDSLRGSSLGLIGGSGFDGSAVLDLARRLGMTVYCDASRDVRKNELLLAQGAIVLPSAADVVHCSRFISIHRRVAEGTSRSIGRREFDAMQPRSIVVNTAGADLFDPTALFTDLTRHEGFKIQTLILDMPFVEADRSIDLRSSNNIRLAESSRVVFTPRQSGYTRQAVLAAHREVSHKMFGLLEA